MTTALSTSAQTNVTSGRTVVPLGGLKTFTKNDGTTTYTIDNSQLQKITVNGNTSNVYLFPEEGGSYNTDDNKALGIQGFYIDLGEAKTIGNINTTWEGAAAGGKVYVTNTQPADDGTLSDETEIASFSNAQETVKNATVTVANSGRYIVFVPTTATNYGWGVKIRTFVAYDTYTPVLTTLTASISNLAIFSGNSSQVSYTALDQVGTPYVITPTYESSDEAVATVSGSGLVTGVSTGVATITVGSGVEGRSATVQVKVYDMPTTAPAAPTGDDVTIVYDGTIGAWSDQGWGWGSQQENVSIDGKTCRKGSKLGGMQIPNPLKDYSERDKLVVDVWSAEAHTLTLYFEGEGTSRLFNLNAGWNELQVATSEIAAPENVNYLTFRYHDSVKDGLLIFSNIYYAKGSVVNPCSVVNGVVSGDVTTADETIINASTAPVVDMRGANIVEAVTLSPANPNAIVLVEGTGRVPSQSVDADNLVVFDGLYYRSATGKALTFVDSNTDAIARTMTIDAQAEGVTISRTLAANKWATSYLPFASTQNDAIDVYTFTAMEGDAPVLTRRDGANAHIIPAATPVVIHNTTDAPVDIVATGKVDFYLGATPSSVEQAAVVFKGNYAPFVTDGTQYGVYGDVGAALQLNKLNGATVGCFRSYFTGLSGSYASREIILVDGSTTRVATVTADHVELVPVYNLQGQRIQRPVKGLYIVNGKKVMMK